MQALRPLKDKNKMVDFMRIPCNGNPDLTVPGHLSNRRYTRDQKRTYQRRQAISGMKPFFLQKLRNSSLESIPQSDQYWEFGNINS